MWDITESSVTMMAACIPVLRILLREVRSPSRRGYITDNTNSTQLFRRQSRNTVDDTILSRDDVWAPTSPGGKSIQELQFYADKGLYPSSRGDRLREISLVTYT